MCVASGLPSLDRRDDDAACALDRFSNKRGDFIRPELENLLFQFARRLQPEFVGRQLAAFAEPIGLSDVDDARNGQAALLVHRLHAAETGTRHGAAVIRVAAADDHRSLGLSKNVPVMADGAHDGVVRFRT